MSGRVDDLRLARLAALMLAALLVAGLGSWPTWRLAGRPGLGAMAVAGAVALSASLIGLGLVLSRAGHGRKALAMGFLLGGPVRLVLTLGLAAGLAAWGPWPVVPLLLWTALFYLLFLGAEVGWLSGVLRLEPSRNG